jgi:ABC-type Mn2+/Zn2+ transport system ATPase subunit
MITTISGIDPAKLSVLAKGLGIGFGAETVVADVNVEVKRCQSLALIGMNGSGKSTLLKTLVGLIPAKSGELVVLGRAPGQSPKQIAYLSQFHPSGFILPLRVQDAVRMGRYANHGLMGRMTPTDEALIQSAMRIMGVEDLADQPLRALSGGQQQRVYLAQVFARQADLYILDEPAAGLDAGGRDAYQTAIRDEMARGASVILATHDIQEAMQCDHTMLLARRVVALGNATEVLTPQTLLDAFGIVITGDPQKLNIAVVEREHSHGCD